MNTRVLELIKADLCYHILIEEERIAVRLAAGTGIDALQDFPFGLQLVGHWLKPLSMSDIQAMFPDFLDDTYVQQLLNKQGNSLPLLCKA
jgi:hypothetical protein